MSGSIVSRTRTLLFTSAVLLFPSGVAAQYTARHAGTTLSQTEYYSFAPSYVLPGRAALYPGNATDLPLYQPAGFTIPGETPSLRGERTTDVVERFIGEELAPPFTLELAVLHHFNKPAGLALYLVDHQKKWPDLGFSFYAERESRPAELGLHDFLEDREIFNIKTEKGFQKYWHHIVLHVAEDFIAIFQNGKLIRKEAFQISKANYDLKVAAYLENEPYAQLGNLLQFLGVSRDTLNQKKVEERFGNFRSKIGSGLKYNGLFHFSAGPYLNYATQESVNLLWETSKPSAATLYYGETLPLEKEIKIATKDRAKTDLHNISEVRIGRLNANTKYFYNLKAESEDGEEMESGILTFKTAVENNQPYLFGIIGDTEARPHINDVISKRLWAERPEFVVVLGDLTDGGMKDAKWQWNLEYFAGMNQLFSRIPAFPVPGNGEGDLYWYKKYHSLPDDEAYYSFRYGAAEFFMMNSNERNTEFSPTGRQYRWLDSALAASDAAWKIVAMHHAPYSADEDDYGNSYEGKSDLGDPQVRQLVPLFDKHHVDVILFGHLHTYNTMGPIRDGKLDQNGVWYIQAGGAGGNLEDFAPTRAWFSRKTYAGHHYSTAFVEERRLLVKTYNLEGALIDFFQINK